MFFMETDTYPGHSEIQKILEAIEKITDTKDWDALVVAESELQYILLDKQEWVVYHGLDNKEF